MTPPDPTNRTRRLLLRTGVGMGIAMVIVPIFLALIGMAFASRVPGGLRGATHRPELAEEVDFALGSSSAVALLAPPGIFLSVLCALRLMPEKKRRPGDS